MTLHDMISTPDMNGVGLILRYNASKYLEMKRLKTTEESIMSNEDHLLEQFYNEDMGEAEAKETADGCATCCLPCTTCVSEYRTYHPIAVEKSIIRYSQPQHALQSQEIIFKFTNIQNEDSSQ